MPVLISCSFSCSFPGAEWIISFIPNHVGGEAGKAVVGPESKEPQENTQWQLRIGRQQLRPHFVDKMRVHELRQEAPRRRIGSTGS